jgi:carboxypeptidase Q
MQRPRLLPLAAMVLLAAAGAAEETVDLGVVTRIRDEGFHHSRVMETVEYLSDVIGPRLTGSAPLREANEWTRRQLADWGLADAHLESWGPFGRSWSLNRIAVTLVRPQQRVPLYALPKAWSPPTAGVVRGAALRVDIKSEKDFDQYRGKLAGRVLLLDKPRDLTGPAEPAAAKERRLSAEKLAEVAEFKPGRERTPEQLKERIARTRLRKALAKFLAEQKALATIEESRLDWLGIGVSGTNAYKKADDPGVPALVMAAESYNRLARLLDRGQDVELEIDLAATLSADDEMAYNTVAEIPGGDKRQEVVMAGAHLDSWHAGTGATDNAAGCAVVMEAVRILAALHLQPRRTVRVALWSGEEEGLLGSSAYVAQHFGSRAEPADPEQRELPSYLRTDSAPLIVKPEHARLAAYFNVDNGSGKIRGIYAQENAAAGPIFAAWLAPFHDLGADTVSLRAVGSTDHVVFDRIGLPAFQFIQDPLDYESHTHHTDADVFDHVQRDDLMQASVILASLLYDAAMRPALLPRKPLPQTVKASPPAAARPSGARAGSKPPAG